jgi:hypothetical protein
MKDAFDRGGNGQGSRSTAISPLPNCTKPSCRYPKPNGATESGSTKQPRFQKIRKRPRLGASGGSAEAATLLGGTKKPAALMKNLRPSLCSQMGSNFFSHGTRTSLKQYLRRRALESDCRVR